MRSLLAFALASVLAGSTAGCAVYDGPPDVTIAGDQQGELMGPPGDIVLDFSKAPKPETLRIKLARYVTDTEGNLADEDSDPKTQLDLLYTHDATADDPGFSKDHLTFTFTPTTTPCAATPLVLIVEPGLADAKGTVTTVRRRIVFSYIAPMACDAPATVLQQGTYFFLASVTKPVATQVKLYGVVNIDPMTGQIKARFTKAKRNPDPNRCTPPCNSTDACRTLPAPMCVAPSEPAGSTDEYPDFVPDLDPVTGFGFATTGCTADQCGGSATFVTVPVDIVVKSPPVTLKNGALNGSFAVDGAGVLRGSGSLTATAVLLGTFDDGMGQGDLTARLIPAADVPSGLPQP